MNNLKKACLFLLLGFASLLPILAFAQVETERVDLGHRNHVPLFDCGIFRDRIDRNACQELTHGRPYRWSDGGYAVSCSNFRSRRDREECLDLSASVTYNYSAFSCRHRDELCETTREAYARGEFRRSYRRPVTTTTTTTIIHDEPVRYRGPVCDGGYYDRAYQRWSEAKREQEERGRRRATVGILTTIGGIILSGSDNETVSTIGTGMAVGGVFLTTWGLVEMADANSTYAPHLDPACSGSFRRETKRVVVERRECISHRYTEHGWGSSRTYYEVRCESRSYVTYERFDEWERSSRWVH